MPGSYIVTEYPQGAQYPHDIAFRLRENFEGTVPQYESQLKSEIERTLVVLKAILSTKDHSFREYFTELLALSRYGLIGDVPQPEQARQTLAILQQRIFEQEKTNAIRKHMFGIIYSQIIMLLLAGALIAAGVPLAWNYGYVGDMSLYLPLLGVLPGLSIGILFSSFLRCKAVIFYDLHAIEVDGFTPFLKCLFALVVLSLTAFFLKAQLFEITLGRVRLSAFDNDLLSAVVFGAVVGIAQEAIVSRIEHVRRKIAPDGGTH